MSNSWSKIEEKIYSENPHLLNIERGQRFLSKYYGVITATNITHYTQDIIDVYGFNSKSCLPRNERSYNLEVIGKEITLENILVWLSQKDHYSVSMDRGKFYIFGLSWEFGKHINEQSQELIDHLLSL